MTMMMTETHYLDTSIHVPSNDDPEGEHGLLIFVWSDRLSCVCFCSPWMMDDANGR